jgi:hypothetical protein
MKKKTIHLVGLVLIGFVSAQELVRNPGRPLNPDGGRTLRLEPIYTIRGDTGEFFFKFPYRFDLDASGCLYVLDKDQLLKFTPEGGFAGNRLKKGQGPGEMASPFQMISFFTRGDELYVYDGTSKIAHFDPTGRLVDEVRQTAGRFFELIGLADEGFLMRGQTDVSMSGPAGFKEIETSVHLVSRDGRIAKKIAGFTSRVYEGSGFGMDWDNYLQAYDRRDGSLYVSRTCEYQVLRADLSSAAPPVAFTRQYPRAPFVMSVSEKDFYEKFKPPVKDFANDIAALYVGGEGVWVKTSTVTKEKGALYDVFAPGGRFVDSFYFGAARDLALAAPPFVIVIERDAEENILLKKYRILNGPRT